jgi:hypothetical protein
MNEHVIEFIRGLRTKRELQATLIDGEWGSGKTYLVKSALKGADPLYISVNGAKTTDELRMRLFNEIYPLLSSGTFKVLGSLAKSVAGIFRLKTDLKLGDIADIPTDRILIIDDLERKAMPIQELFGFINEFVEHGDNQVVLIANDREIKDADYKTLKEKVIGYTLRVHPDLLQAVDHFIEDLDPNYIRFIQNRKSKIQEILREINVSNLRIVRHVINDFSTIYHILIKDIDDEQINDMFLLYLAITGLLKTGQMDRSDLLRRPTEPYFAGWLLHDKTKSDVLRGISKRLSQIDLFSPVLSNEFLANRILDGFIDTDQLRAGINDQKSKTDGSVNPSWRVLWYYLDLSDQEFLTALDRFASDWQNRNFTVPGEIIHACGVHLELSKEGFLSKSSAQSEAECASYIEDLKSMTLTLNNDEPWWEHHNSGAFGLGFLQTGPFLNTLVERISRIIAEKSKAELIQELRGAMEDLPVSIGRLRELLLGQEGSRNLADDSALNELDVEKVVDQIMGSEAAVQRTFMSILQTRRRADHALVVFPAEMAWLRLFRVKLLMEARKAGGITHRRILKFVNWSLPPSLFVKEKPSTLSSSGAARTVP